MKTNEKIALYYAKRTERLNLNKRAALLEEEEKALIQELSTDPKFKTNDDWIVKSKPSKEPFVEDWGLLMAYIKENQAVDLFEKRLLKSAANLRLEEGTTLPGVKISEKTTYSVTPQPTKA